MPPDGALSVTAADVGTSPSPTRWRMLRTARRVRERAGEIAFLVPVVVLLLAPLVALVENTLDDFSASWASARARRDLGEVAVNTLGLAVASVVVALLLGGGLAWCLRHLPPNLRRIGLGLSLIPLLVPSLPSIMAWVLLLQPRAGKLNQLLRATPFFGGDTGPIDVYTVPFIVLFTAIHFVPFVALFLTTALQALDERLDHAARISGASWLTTQLRIVVPLIRPAIVYAVALVAIFGLGQFTTPLILGRPNGVDVITTEMWRAVNYSPISYEVASLLGAPLVLAGFLLVAVQRRAIGEGAQYVATSHGTEGAADQRRWPMIPIALFGFLMVVPPVVTLIWVSLLPYWNPNLGFADVTLDNYRRIFDDPSTSTAITNSLRLAVAGTLLGLATCTGMAIIATRSGNTIRGRIVDYLVNLPITIPGIVFGLGVFLAFAAGPLQLTGSPWLFVIIFVLSTLPHGTRLVMAGLAQVGTSGELAARVHGASAPRALVSILLPLIRRSLASAMIVMFVLMIQEFGAATMVQSPRTDVMATRMFAMWEEGFLQTEAAAMGVVMCAICALGTAVLLRFSAHGLRLRRARR